MMRGTTPTHTFFFKYDTDLLEKLKITYAQDGEIILEKRKEDCELGENSVTVKLTQEETFSFAAGKNVEIQIRGKQKDGTVVGTTPINVSAERCLDEEIL